VTGWFERMMNRIPMAIASALLAGVLVNFGMAGLQPRRTAALLLVLAMVAHLSARASAWSAAVCGAAYAAGIHRRLRCAQGRHCPGCAVAAWELAAAGVDHAAFHLAARTVSVALPLFVVTMASQNVPGVAAIKARGLWRRAPDTRVAP
jgi:benzoate membrane transport protein